MGVVVPRGNGPTTDGGCPIGVIVCRGRCPEGVVVPRGSCPRVVVIAW